MEKVVKNLEFNKLKFKTKSEAVYLELREKIINGELQPNTPLVTHKIAKEFGVSETPVREAIKRLKSEGLVEIIPHSGIRVSIPSVKEFEEILQVRLTLESLATRLCVNNISQEGLKQLQNLMDKLQISKDKDIDKYGILDKKFHTLIYKNCGNDYLFKLIIDLWNKTERTRSIFKLFPTQMDISLQEHKKLVELIAKGDDQGASELIEKHRKRTFDRLLKHFKKYCNKIAIK